MEIERKFLVKELPETLQNYAAKHLEQAYLCTDPVLRIRRSGKECWLTCKGAGLMIREELELPIGEEAYRHLLAKADGYIIQKTRWMIPYEGRLVELDVFEGALAPLVVAEVEFETEEQALAFAPPAWFGKEVTCDPRYANAALSRRGKPPALDK